MGFKTYEENSQLLKKYHKWEHLLQYFQREAGHAWRKDLKLSFCIISPPVYQIDLFYHVFPQKLANDGLLVKIVNESRPSQDSYKFCFKFENEDLVLNYLEIETGTRLWLLNKILSRNEIIKAMNITEKSINSSAEPETIKYILQTFPACINKVEMYTIKLPGDSDDLLVDKIKALESLKELTIIWEPYLMDFGAGGCGFYFPDVYPVVRPSIKKIALMIRNKNFLETLDLKIKQSHNLDDLDQLLQELFNLPKFRKFSLDCYCGYSLKRSAMLNFHKCLDLESTLGISKTQVVIEKSGGLSYNSYNNKNYQFKSVYERN